MAECYLELIEAIEHTLIEHNLTRLALRTFEKSDLIKLVNFLVDFDEYSETPSASKYTVVGVGYLMFDLILNKIQTMLVNDDESEWLREAGQVILDKLESYSTKFYDWVVYGCVFLDSRVDMNVIPVSLKSSQNVSVFVDYVRVHYAVNEVVELVVNRNEEGENEEHASCPKPARERLMNELKPKKRLHICTVDEEIEEYQTHPVLEIDPDPLAFWRDESDRFPSLSIAAQNFLSVQPSSVASES
ncbi:hypothetical protein GEMRC1_013539 [Eukaryota sp. GEM-RC1]